MIPKFRRLAVLETMLFCCGLFFAPGALAKEIPLIVPISGVSLLDPTYPPPPGGPYPYAQTGGTLSWSVGPWGSWGGKMPAFAKSQKGNETFYTTQSQGAAVSVIAGPNGTTLTLGQNGQALACNSPNGRPLEFDLFAEPNGQKALPPQVPGYLPFNQDQVALSNLSHLTFEAEVTLRQSLAVSRKNCDANFGGLVFAVILTEYKVKPYQTLFYQFFFSRFCGTNTFVKLAKCSPPQDLYQFFVKNPFGLNDYGPLAGVPWLQDSRPTQIKTDLLPRLLRCIQIAKGGIDHDPSDWKVSSIYLGQNMYGDVTIHSAWRNVHLIASYP